MKAPNIDWERVAIDKRMFKDYFPDSLEYDLGYFLGRQQMRRFLFLTIMVGLSVRLLALPGRPPRLLNKEISSIFEHIQAYSR